MSGQLVDKSRSADGDAPPHPEDHEVVVDDRVALMSQGSSPADGRRSLQVAGERRPRWMASVYVVLVVCLLVAFLFLRYTRRSSSPADETSLPSYRNVAFSPCLQPPLADTPFCRVSGHVPPSFLRRTCTCCVVKPAVDLRRTTLPFSPTFANAWCVTFTPVGGWCYVGGPSPVCHALHGQRI